LNERVWLVAFCMAWQLWSSSNQSHKKKMRVNLHPSTEPHSGCFLALTGIKLLTP